MASDGQPYGTAVHATAVAIAGRAILLFGPSKSGKSSLAAALIARSSSSVPILLVGDDRILLQPAGLRMMARAHPRIAGFIERRGFGIVASPFIEQAAVDGIVCLGRTTVPRRDLANFPLLRLVVCKRDGASADQISTVDRVLAWVRNRAEAAAGTQVAAKDDSSATTTPKD